MLSSLCLCGKDHSGFTLLEIVLAIFIFASVLSMIYTSYTGTFRIIDETEDQADIYRMARIALERMSEDLESVYIPQYLEAAESDEESDHVVEFVGEEKEINGRRGDSIRFTSTAHIVFGEEDQASGTAEIEYYVGENEGEEDLVLYRKDTPSMGETADKEKPGLVLCEKLQSVSFTYHDAEGDEFGKWDSTGVEFKNTIPKMVSILLEFVNELDPEAPFKFSTTVALPMGTEKESA